VVDGWGREYVRASGPGRVSFRAAGAAGEHVVRLLDPAGRTLAESRFRLEPRTTIEDAGGAGVEADVEYLFVEGVHAAWRMSGDDAWMARHGVSCGLLAEMLDRAGRREDAQRFRRRERDVRERLSLSRSRS
jgi:hypothetical protein